MNVNTLRNQLHEVNRDIVGTLMAGVHNERALKLFNEMREYRTHLEDEIALKLIGQADEPGIISITTNIN